MAAAAAAAAETTVVVVAEEEKKQEQDQKQEEGKGEKLNPTWAELLGSEHWRGLLDPLNPALRRLILLSGDLCQVTYDAFNDDRNSAYCGSCRYSKPSLLRRVAFVPPPSAPAAGLAVSAYLYATSQVSLPEGFLLFSKSREAWSRESNWIGYVAVGDDVDGGRVIFAAWRGTIRTLEWADVLQPELVSIDDILSSSPAGDDGELDKPKVMKGWHVIYTSSDPKSPFSKLSARAQFLSAIRTLVARHAAESAGRGLSIVCTGHSLGAALATLSAFDVVENGIARVGGRPVPVAAIAFGSPQLGNAAFRKRLESLPNLRVLHVKNKPDLIPLYPSGLLGYVDAGDLLVVNSRKSPYLKDSKNPGDYHNLQGILHTVAGWSGEGGDFKPQVKRSVALVNKSSAYLKDEYLIPESWWAEKNKGMVLGDDGEWRLALPAEEDLPVPPPDGMADMVSFDAASDKNVDGGKGTKGEDVDVPVVKKPKKSFSLVYCFRAIE
ncbi:phospholipase A1-II 5-like [Ananas comosus]|uniref:Phospholipase A1 n=1 Tax=Ananas comosus TaxID=4615 RepID=A0A6P5G5F2_ANACO|nr:phospholipase A1-II 5-like [Ananas comosus]